MKNSSIDFHLATARPKHTQNNVQFTDAVMQKINNNEINTVMIRTMNRTNKKEKFIMKLHKLPMLATLLLAAGMVFALSATSYAIYTILFQPKVIQQSVSTTSSGRTELAFNIQQCGDTRGRARYELKKNATITESQAKDVIAAQCELELIHKWFNSVTPEKYRPSSLQFSTNVKAGEKFTSYNSLHSFAVKVKNNVKGILTITGVGMYGAEDEILKTAKDTKYVIDGKIQQSSDGIMPGDAISYLSLEEMNGVYPADCTNQHCSISSQAGMTVIPYVVKLSKPYEMYTASSSLIELYPCPGNEDSDCRQGNIGSIDLIAQPSVAQDISNIDFKIIDGKLVDIQQNSFTIQASSGKNYTFKTSYNRIADFNRSRLGNYNINPIAVGDSLEVSYYQGKGSTSRAINESEIARVVVLLEMLSKGDPINKF
jgi:hypothetical protein